MKALITGGAGFIGSALARRMLNAGYSVTIIDNFTRNALKHFPEIERSSRLVLIKGDVCDETIYKNLPSDFTHIFHLAAIAGVSRYFAIPADVMRVNTVGTLKLLEFARSQHSLELLIDFSTSEVYGSNCYGASEESDIRMERLTEKRWTYACSKIASERLVMTFYWQYGLPITIVRPFNIFGPGQVGEGAISNFISCALSEKPLLITGNGEQLRSFCYIDDMLDALDVIIKCANTNPPSVLGECFNVGNELGIISMRTLAEIVIDLVGSTSAIEFISHLGADVMIRSPDIKKISLLGYKPRVTLREGIKISAEWYSSHYI